ncbi:hypothetical protein [Microbulbifer sp. GL-2]|uniref:hypothetical protein n=1 Tax=Microbulbifer sp. GL-2 TaxID=2591606 RepID=UPI0011806357|nr:hypothetical protein [Microbulbifer sp. GL-2]
MKNNPHITPASNTSTIGENHSAKAGATLTIFAWLAVTLAFTASFLGQFLKTGNIAVGIGGGLAPIIMGIIIVAIFQIGKPFRNSKSRCKILLWTQIVLMLGSISNLISYFSRGY